jgi:hypothetical protein
MVIFSICSSALAAPNLKDLPRRPRLNACVLVGNFAQEGKFTLAVQWIVRSGRTFLHYRLLLLSMQPNLRLAKNACPKWRSDSGKRYGLFIALRTTSASLATTGRVFLVPYREAHRDHCSLLQLFKSSKARRN